MLRFILSFATVAVLAPTLCADIVVQPARVELTGPQATQRVIVLQTSAGRVVGNPTDVRWSSSKPGVARVTDAGFIEAVGDGKAVITAKTGKQVATVEVKVAGTGNEFVPNFRNHVIPVLTRLNCNSGGCHGALAGKGGFKLSLRGFSPEDDHFVLTRQALGRRVNTRHPSKSLLLLKPTMAITHGGGLKLDIDSPEFRLLADWIASGAPGPNKNDANITKLDVFPPAARLKPKDMLQLVVRAWYSDGRSEDVTRWAKFASTEDLVAGVDESGQVQVNGHGESAITVFFSNLVALTRIQSPLQNDVPDKVFAQAPRHNFIDELGLKKLQELRIPPSPPCSDEVFIRRAYLDAIGALPTPEEVKTFLADKRKDKRARVIDRLLAREEFVDYWSYKWSDLLLISSRSLPEPAMRSFYQFVRRSVADNKPWDRFAREILTAQGSNLRNGAANYFVLHKDVADLTETTAVTFLGMSITCARCHNHPLEKWTQDQYWSMASLFSRVGLKNGKLGGEVSVQSQTAGEVLHPRRGEPMPATPLDYQPMGEGNLNRREYFARWLTDPANPFFARALANRVWQNFLGRGLVESVDDLRQTNPASNEELLNALAQDFVRHGFDVKHLIRGIMNSATYQRSATPLPENQNDDRFYSHYLVRRLPAEVLLDAYSRVTGVPTQFGKVQVGVTGGDRATGDYPLGTRALQLPDTQLVSGFLDAFGRPERSQPCACERQQESSVTQALQLNNGQTLNDKLRDKKSRVEDWLKEKISDDEAIDRIYLIALSRHPTSQERDRLRTLMAEAARDPETSRRQTLEDLFWAILTAREFLFNH